MRETKKCPFCENEEKLLTKHVQAVHPNDYRVQEKIVMRLAKEELLSNVGIVKHEDNLIFGSASSVGRVLKKLCTPEELEEGRKAKIGKHVKAAYAAGEMDWVTDLNVARNKSDEGRQKNSDGNKRAWIKRRAKKDEA